MEWTAELRRWDGLAWNWEGASREACFPGVLGGGKICRS